MWELLQITLKNKTRGYVWEKFTINPPRLSGNINLTIMSAYVDSVTFTFAFKEVEIYGYIPGKRLLIMYCFEADVEFRTTREIQMICTLKKYVIKFSKRVVIIGQIHTNLDTVITGMYQTATTTKAPWNDWHKYASNDQHLVHQRHSQTSKAALAAMTTIMK